MSASDDLQVYRRLVATADDSVVNWWYSGWTFVNIASLPPIPFMRVVAVMTYRAQTLATNRLRVHWSEIGAFFDPTTGEPPTVWTNPVTGARVEPPRSFREGPGHMTVEAEAEGLRLAVEQPNAQMLETRVALGRAGRRLTIRQLERKRRGFPLPNGALPSAQSSSGFEAVTELCFFADAADLQGEPRRAMPCQGLYAFTLGGLPPWMGFGDGAAGTTTTRGVIGRALPEAVLDHGAWRVLQALFPEESASPLAARPGP